MEAVFCNRRAGSAQKEMLHNAEFAGDRQERLWRSLHRALASFLFFLFSLFYFLFLFSLSIFSFFPRGRTSPFLFLFSFLFYSFLYYIFNISAYKLCYKSWEEKSYAIYIRHKSCAITLLCNKLGGRSYTYKPNGVQKLYV
jgi:hypothetical protein